MRDKMLKRVIVMMLALSMLITGTGATAFADSLGESAEIGAPETAVTEQAQDAEEIDEEEVPAAEAGASAEKAEEAKKDADAAEAAKLTAKDWEAKLPSNISKDAREAMAQVAESQLKEDTALYKAFANADSLKEGDASFAMFVLEYANVLSVSKAIGKDSNGTVKNGDISVPVDADTGEWVKALKEAGLYKEISEDILPEQGDIVFIEGRAAVVLKAADGSFTVAGIKAAKDEAVSKFDAGSADIGGFVSLRDLAPERFADEAVEAATDDTAASADSEADTAEAEDAESALTAEEVAEAEAAKKAEAEAAKAAKAKAEGLSDQTIAAELTSAPGVGGKLRSLFTSTNGTEITVSGLLPEDATVKAYPVSVTIPGQNVLTAYDITIYTKDADGKELVWQPGEALNVSIKDKALNEVSGELGIYHMEKKDAAPEFVMDSVATEGEVTFAADAFSIYIVTKNATKTFNFINDGQVYSKQVLENGQTLVEPPAPSKSGAVFKYWSATENGSIAYDKFDQPVSVSDSDNAPANIYAVYEEHMWLVTFHDQTGGIVDKQLKSGSETVDPSEVGYTPIQTEEDSHLRFLYWTDDPDGEKTEKGTFNPTKDTDLYPVVEAGHWIYFDKIKKKATYASAVFVLPGEENKPGVSKAVSLTTCDGYAFQGWYTRKNGGVQVFDETGHLNAEGYAKITKNGELYSEPTLYAHWTEGEATYTVNYYIQKASDSVGGDKHYEFYKAGGKRRAQAGTEVSLDSDVDTVEAVFSAASGASQEEQALAMQNLHGFILSDGNQSVVVKADGSTELQVKFDRKSYKLKFFNFYGGGTSNQVKAVNDDVVTTRTNSAYTHGTSSSSLGNYIYKDDNNGTFYFWNNPNATSGQNAMPQKTIEALYGHDISNEFGFDVKYQTGTEGRRNTINWNGSWNSSNKIAWYDSDQQSDASCGLKSIFRVLYKMPSLYKTDGTDYSEEVLIHNHRVSTNKEMYYYKEIQEDDYSGSYSTTIGDDYVKKTFDGEECYFQKIYTMYHSYGAVPAFNKDALFQPMEGYDNDANLCEPANLFEMNGGSAAHVPPTKSAVFYTFRNYDLHLVDPVDPTKNETISVKFNSKLTADDLKTYLDSFLDADNVGPIERVEKDGYWYRDEDFGSPVDFNTFEMPARETTFYAGLVESYIVKIDPDGGELHAGVDSSQSYSTWFRAENGTVVGEYENVERDYVAAPANEATHKYVYNQYPTEPRTAKYVQTADGATHRFEKGAYVLTGWVQVGADGSESEYNFSEPVRGNLTLKAKWRRNSNFRIVYDAADTTVSVPADGHKYEDGAHAVAATPLDSPVGRRFKCWKDSAGNEYKPGELVPISEATAVRESAGHMAITLTAQYENYNPQNNIMADYVFKNGNDTYYVQTVSQGETLVYPQTPSRAGEVFTGWYRDQACTQRFDGFGTINNPIYTTLYAGFKSAFTVTYMTEENGSVITSQTYHSGEKLNTSGVEFPVGSGKIMRGWTDGSAEKNVDPYKYNRRTSDSVTGNLTLWPVIGTIEQLSFDSKGGSYVAPVTIPEDRRPAMPKEPEREGFKFDGWFTDADCSGGNEYDFSTSLDAGVTKLYAKWVPDDENVATGELTVLFWAQTPDRPEDDAEATADKTHYELARSIQLTKEYGNYTLSDIETLLATQNVDITSELNLTDVKNRYSKATDNQFKKYFEFNRNKSDQSVTVDKRNDNVINLYYDREKYTIRFDINGSGQIIADKTYTGSNYAIPVWLDKDIADQWPVVDESREGTTKAHINWTASGSSFASWTSPDSQRVDGATTLQLLADYQKIDYAALQSDRTIVFTASATSSIQNVSATVHYYLDGKEAMQQVIHILPNYRYNSNSDYTQYYGSDSKGTKYYSLLLAKEIEGYTCITDSSKSQYNPLITTTDSNGKQTTAARAVVVGSAAPNTSVDLYLYYAKENYTIKLMETSSKPYKNVSVSFETKVSGTDGILATDSSIGKPNPPKAGVEFAGWSTSMASMEEYTSNGGRMPAHDITLYARWKPVQVSITTKIDGVTKEYDSKDYGSTLESFEIPDPEKAGFLFIGWKDSASGKQLGPKDSINSSMMLEPIWRSIVGKTIFYDSNGATGGAAPVDTKKYATGANALILSGTGLVKSTPDIDGVSYDAEFVHWNTRSDDKGTIYYPGSEVVVNDDITLYAIYSSKRQADLIYHKNHADAEFVATDKGEVVEGVTLQTKDDEAGTIRVLFKDDKDLSNRDTDVPGHPNSALTVGHDNNNHEFRVRRPGYKFDNWSVTATATDGDIENDQTAYVNTLGNSNALYAIWDKDTLPIEVYSYKDDETIDDATLVTGSSGAYHQTSVDTSGQTIVSIESKYVAQDDISYNVEGYVFEKAMVGTNEVDQMKYVLKENGTGYEWQYHVKEAAADTFTAIGADKLKIYYYKASNGVLTVSKIVRGKYANMLQPFTFTLSAVEGADDSKEFDIVRSSSDPVKTNKIKVGESFVLKDGENVSITLPRDKAITITETLEDGFKAPTYACSGGANAITGEDSAVTNGQKLTLTDATGTLTVTNEFNDKSVVPSGISGHTNMLMLIMLAFVLATAEFYILLKRRKRGTH